MEEDPAVVGAKRARQEGEADYGANVEADIKTAGADIKTTGADVEAAGADADATAEAARMVVRLQGEAVDEILSRCYLAALDILQGKANNGAFVVLPALGRYLVHMGMPTGQELASSKKLDSGYRIDSRHNKELRRAYHRKQSETLMDFAFPTIYNHIREVFRLAGFKIFERCDSSLLLEHRWGLGVQAFHVDCMDMLHALGRFHDDLEAMNRARSSDRCSRAGTCAAHSITSAQQMQWSFFLALDEDQAIDVACYQGHGKPLKTKRVRLPVNVPVLMAGHTIHRGSSFVGKGTLLNRVFKIFGEVEATGGNLVSMSKSMQAWIHEDPDTGAMLRVMQSKPNGPLFQPNYAGTIELAGVTKMGKIIVY